MASLKLLLEWSINYKIEQAEKALVTEFEKLHTFSESEQLAKYNELNKLVNSTDFVQKGKKLNLSSIKVLRNTLKKKSF